MTEQNKNTDRGPKETDDIIFALEKAYNLLGNKSLPKDSRGGWLKALKPYDTNLILDAIDSHISGASGTDSKYVPKPKHIIDLIGGSRDRARGFSEDTGEVMNECDPRIAKAWVMYMNEALGFNVTPDRNPHIKMTREEMILIVNQQAKKHNRPDSILDKYRINE